MSKEYLKILTQHPNTRLWKLVKTHEEWYPNWENSTFLVLLNETLATTNKPKRSKTYYIYCCGLDDFEMVTRNIKWSEAKHLFNQIKDYHTTRKELENLGFVVGG